MRSDIVSTVNPFQAAIFPRLMKVRNYENGQILCLCPWHDDKNPSFSINVNTTQFFCHSASCGVRGNYKLLFQKLQLTPSKEVLDFIKSTDKKVTQSPEATEKDLTTIPEDALARYQKDMNQGVRKLLIEERGLSEAVIEGYQLGYDIKSKRVCIPVFDEEGRLRNIRKWSKRENMKIISYRKGYGKARIFPVDVLKETNVVVLCEGEMDSLRLLSEGIDAVTVTGGAGTWKPEFNQYFQGKSVIICYDNDEAGNKGARKVAKSLYKDGINVSITIWDGEVNYQGDVTDFFNNGGTKEEFQAILSSAKPYKDGVSNIDWDSVEEGPRYLFPSQDYIEGVLYYGSVINDNVYILSSQRELCEIKEILNKGFIVRGFDKHYLRRLKANTVRDFIEREEKVDSKDLFETVVQFIRRFVVLQDDSEYLLLTIWVIGTYLFRVFQFYPYLHFQAEKQSGKTRTLEVLSELSFNSEMSINHTEATLFRTIETAQPTLLIDEVDNLRKKDKDFKGAIFSILNNGFSKSGTVPRCKPKTFEIERFHCFSPKALAGIKDLDDVLRDRVISINILRKLPFEKVKRFRPSRMRAEVEEIRSKLYIFALGNCRKIESILNGDPIAENISLSDREIDIWEPLVAIAKFIDRDDKILYPQLIKYAVNSSTLRRERDQGENETLNTIQTFAEFLHANNPDKDQGSYRTERVYTWFRGQDEWVWLTSKSQLTRRLKRIGIRTRTVRFEEKTERCYVVIEDDFNDLAMRYVGR